MIAVVMVIVAAIVAGSPGGPAEAGPYTSGQTQTGTIRGRVVDADTGNLVSVPRAGSEATGWAPVFDGEFVLNDVRPGRHLIGVQGQYLATRLTLPVPVVVTPGGLHTVELRVRLEGQASGRVVDSTGAPVPGVTMVAVSAEYTRTGPYGSEPELGLRLWYHRDSVALTDADGRYMLERLRAGRPYRILAFVARVFERPVSRAPLDPAARADTVGAAYHPSAATFEAAAPVIVSSGSLRANVDVVLPRAPAYCVEARVTADGEPAQMAVSVEPDDAARLVAGATSSRPPWPVSGQTTPDGRLRACDLVPGRYRLTAGETLNPMADEYRGSTTFEVIDADATGIEVDARAAVPVSGTIVYDGTPLAEPPEVRVVPQIQIGPARLARATVPGDFTVYFAPNRDYSLAVDALPPGFFVRGVQFDGRDVMHAPLGVQPGATDASLRIEIADGAGSIAASARDASGQPADGAVVILQPADAFAPEQVASGLRAIAVDETGRALFENLPPGQYHVMATRVPPLMVVQLPFGRVKIARSPETIDLLIRTRPLGERVEVAPGRQSPVSLALATIR